MRTLLFVLLAACASKPAPAPQQPPAGPVTDSRSSLEQRRDKACDIVGRRTALCAAEDSKALLAAGKIKQAEYEKATEQRVIDKDAEVYADKCKAKRDYSSRQIRVLEKCPEYETQCGPFLECLQNLQPQAK